MSKVLNMVGGGGGGGIKLSSIAITEAPTKTSYRPGETFSPAGIVVTATYSNGATAIATGYTFFPSTPLTLDDTEVTIQYTEMGVTRTAQQAITVQNEAIQVPTQSGTLTYTGSEQEPKWSGYDSNKMEIGGTTSGVNAGDYIATFTPKYGYCWPDNTTAEKTVAWSIEKALGSLSLDKTSVTLNSSTTSATVTATKTGDGALSVSSSNTSVATASVSGNTVTISSVNGSSGTATVAVSMAESTNYTGATATVSVSAQFNVIVGVHWNAANSSTEMERLTIENDPNHLVNTNITTEPVPAVGNGVGSSPFDNLEPWSRMDEYNILSENVIYKRGDANFSRSRDTLVLIPQYFYKVIKNGTDWYFYVSSGAVSGFERHPGSGKYVGRYNTCDGYISASGFPPLVSITRAQARTGSSGKGNKWSEYDFASWCAVEFLFRVEFASWDSQSKVGMGIVNDSYAHNTGETDSMVYHTGRAAGENGKTAVQYRHIENPWGNVFEWIDGINFNNRVSYICLDHTKYADDTETNYTNTGVSLAGTNGFITNIGFNSAFPWSFLPTTSGGSETTHIPDYVYTNSGWRVLYVGGSWSHGSLAGLWYVHADSASSASGAGFGARLLYNP